MTYYPVLLNIQDKPCLVVGGGPVGARKTTGLLRSGARVTVVSPAFCEQFNALREKPMFCKKMVCMKKEYEITDLEGMSIVFAATGNAQLNKQIMQDTRQQNMMCNIVDAPDDSNFILPSVVQQGDLILAVSTSGKSPALSKKIRKELEQHFGPEYQKMLFVMGNIRKRLLAQEHAPKRHKKIFYTLIETGLLEMIKVGDEKKINSVLNDLLGNEYNYQDLVLQRSNE